MPKTFDSVEEALSYVSDELAEVRAEALAVEAIAVVVLQTLIREEIADLEALGESVRAQLSAVRFAGGDADLNADLRARAEKRLTAILSALTRAH